MYIHDAYLMSHGHSTEQKELVVLNIYQMLEQKLLFRFEAQSGNY